MSRKKTFVLLCFIGFLCVGLMFLTRTLDKQNILEPVNPTLPKSNIVEKFSGHGLIPQKVEPNRPSVNVAARFSQEVKEVYFRDVEETFTVAAQTLDKARLNGKLMALNQRGQIGVDAILGRLGGPPATDAEIVNRLHLVTYLKYRCKFDPETRAKLANFLQTPYESADIKETGVIVAERAEMLGALAGHDWAKAEAVIRAEKKTELKDLMAYEAYYNLKDKSGKKYAFDTVSEVVPNFPLPPGERP